MLLLYDLNLKELFAKFKVPQCWQCPIYNGTLVFKGLNSVNSLMLSCRRNAQVTFAEKPQFEISLLYL